jgi:hypothetical protein
MSGGEFSAISQSRPRGWAAGMAQVVSDGQLADDQT